MSLCHNRARGAQKARESLGNVITEEKERTIALTGSFAESQSQRRNIQIKMSQCKVMPVSMILMKRTEGQASTVIVKLLHVGNS